MNSKNYKISFCIVCMNRLHQLRETLIKNITDNEDYLDLEFVLLDYNSQDGMKEWAEEHLMEYIKQGRLVYYHTTEPQEFSHSHAKNLAFKLASGDIVCNINADHYTGKGFAEYVNASFKRDKNIVLTTVDFYRTRKNYRPAKDVFGKVCVKKSDFLAVEGFDERMKKYGFEDWDLINRLEMIHLKRDLIDNSSFLRFIPHTDEERYACQSNEFHCIYVKKHNPYTSELINLYKDHRFQRGTFINNLHFKCDDFRYSYKEREYRFKSCLLEREWQEGVWEESKTEYNLMVPSSGSVKAKKLKKDRIVLASESKSGVVFHKATDEKISLGIQEFNNVFDNMCILESNLDAGTVQCNRGVFGFASLYKNFDHLSFKQL